MLDARHILGLPSCYRWFQRTVAGDYRTEYVRKYVQPREGMRILDVGCGTGDILNHLPQVDYLGIDLSSSYVESARKHFGTRGSFRCESIAETAIRDEACYDIVMANGVMHHLEDEDVRCLFRVAHRVLKPNGRLVTHDGCIVPKQSKVARMLLKLDRGRHVRTREAYISLAKEVFSSVQAHIRHDMLRVPSTLCILVSTRTAKSGTGTGYENQKMAA